MSEDFWDAVLRSGSWLGNPEWWDWIEEAIQ